MVLPKRVQKFLVRKLGRIVFNLYGFSVSGLVAANIFIGRGWRNSAGVAHPGCDNARQLAEVASTPQKQPAAKVALAMSKTPRPDYSGTRLDELIVEKWHPMKRHPINGRAVGERKAVCSRRKWAYDVWPQSRASTRWLRFFSGHGEDNMILMGVNLWSVLVDAIADNGDLGFLWYSPDGAPSPKPWMFELWATILTTRPKSKKCKKGAGKKYADCLFWPAWFPPFILGKVIDAATVRYRSSTGMKFGFAMWLGFVTTVQLTAKSFRQRANQVVFDQYGLSTCLLSGYGCDHRGMAALTGEHDQDSTQAAYSITMPPVKSATLSTRCSAHQFSSSPAIFSVATGSQ